MLHLLVACAPILLNFGGITANDLRRANGLPATIPRPVAVRRPLPSPKRRGPLLLGGGGGEQIAAAVLDRVRPNPQAVWVGLDPHRRGYAIAAAEWARHGVAIVDSELDSAADADRPDVIDRIGSADVILLGGGRVASLYASLTAGRAIDALIAASDNGALVVGSSASSNLLGAVAADPYGDEGAVKEPTLAWLPGVAVSTHHSDRPESLATLRRCLWPFLDDEQVLLVPHAGAVWIEPGWKTATELDPGDHGIGAHWWTAPDTPPTRLTPSVALPTS